MHALVTADTIGGVWMYARELVTGLVRRGVKVTLVSFGEIPAPQQTEWIDGLRDVDFRPTAFHLEWMQDAEEDLELSSEYLLSLIHETKPDVLHLNQFCYGSLPVDVPRIVVAHSDVVSWWVSVHGEEPRENRWMRWYRETVTRGLAHANTVVAPSQWMLDSLHSYYTRPADGRVIYNGRTPHLFNPHVTKEDAVVTVGRIWDAGKQVSLLTKLESAVPIYIAGSEQHPDSTVTSERKVSPGAQRKIIYKGQQTEGQLRQLYSRASMYAATSRYEPFGLAPLEAALSRCAIIANDIPTFHELWGDTAYFFRYNDADSLAHAIHRLNSDRELRVTYANLAYHHARQQFTAERMIEQYVTLYETLTRAEATAA